MPTSSKKGNGNIPPGRGGLQPGKPRPGSEGRKSSNYGNLQPGIPRGEGRNQSYNNLQLRPGPKGPGRNELLFSNLQSKPGPNVPTPRTFKGSPGQMTPIDNLKRLAMRRLSRSRA